MKTRYLTSEEWNKICDLVEEIFPKGQCQERGRALVLVPKMLLILNILPKEYEKTESKTNKTSVSKEVRQKS